LYEDDLLRTLRKYTEKSMTGENGEHKLRVEDRDKFVRLANKRVSNALRAIQLIGNLSNKSNYDYADEDVVKILKALTDEVAACRKRFDLAQKKQGNIRFTLE
jgi:hypothetical protein